MRKKAHNRLTAVRNRRGGQQTLLRHGGYGGAGAKRPFRTQLHQRKMDWNTDTRPTFGAWLASMSKAVYAIGGIFLVLLIFNIILASSMPSDAASKYVLASYTLTAEGSSEAQRETIAGRLGDYSLLTSAKLGNTGTGVRSHVSAECGSQLYLSDFVSEKVLPEAQFVTDVSSISMETPGYYKVEIMAKGKLCTSVLIVVDSTAPYLSSRDASVWLGEELQPEDFLSSARDATGLTYSFVSEPNFNRAGEYQVTVRATDMGGNSSTANAVCVITEDVQPPVISGVTDRTIYIGDTVEYKKDITATDNRDGEVDISVDVRGVNPNAEGTYTVTYTATDSTGLSATAKAEFTFMYSEESLQIMKLNEMLEPVLEQLIEPDMTDREKAKEIYKWVQKSINYSGTSDKSSWYACAMEGLTTRNGDCYTYFALSKALLTAAGIENVDVIRIDNPQRHPLARHYWNMVYIEDNWYHFDATPRADGTTFFLWTTKELLKYSDTHLWSHDFDPEEYPKTP